MPAQSSDFGRGTYSARGTIPRISLDHNVAGRRRARLTRLPQHILHPDDPIQIGEFKP
jgi:hypothetical protein